MRGFLILGMNYLAHIHLSGENEDVMLGNFMADGIKGRKHEMYRRDIQKGILLHRFIDDFTDSHTVVLETKLLFRPKYGKLAPILVDILYDHYLAKNWADYHPEPLKEFVAKTYHSLQSRWDELTPRVQHMLPYMIRYNWLYNYQFQTGMERVLEGMSRRVPTGEILKHGWQDLQPYYEIINDHFAKFFVEMIQEAKRWFQDYEVKKAGS
jgi:acyl carrier protein phosphodiesterase